MFFSRTLFFCLFHVNKMNENLLKILVYFDIWIFFVIATGLPTPLTPHFSPSFMAFYFDIDDRLKLVDGNKCGFLLNIAYVYIYGRL